MGDGSFQGRRDYPTGLSPQSVVIGDLNGDGKPDLATANCLARFRDDRRGRRFFYPNTVSVLLNRGGGSFQARLDYATGSVPSRSPSAT